MINPRRGKSSAYIDVVTLTPRPLEARALCVMAAVLTTSNVRVLGMDTVGLQVIPVSVNRVWSSNGACGAVS